MSGARTKPGAEENRYASLIMTILQQNSRVKPPREDRVRLSGSNCLTSANVLRVRQRRRHTRTAMAVIGSSAGDLTTRPTPRSRRGQRASRLRNLMTMEKRSRADFAAPPTRARRNARSASRPTTPSERLCRIAIPWRACRIGWKTRDKSRLVDSDSREINATVEERY